MSLDQSETPAQRAVLEREQARAKAVTCSLRHEILMILTAREACPKEVAEELGEKLHTVMYHFRWLSGQKPKLNSVPFIEMVGTDRRLGGIQHLWKAIAMPMVGIEDARSQTLNEREETSAMILRRMHDDMVGAVNTGTMDAHPQRSLLRMHTELDDAGIEAAAELAEAYLEDLKTIAGESKNRIAKGSTGFPVATETMIFPVPGIYWNGI